MVVVSASCHSIQIRESELYADWANIFSPALSQESRVAGNNYWPNDRIRPSPLIRLLSDTFSHFPLLAGCLVKLHFYTNYSNCNKHISKNWSCHNKSLLEKLLLCFEQNPWLQHTYTGVVGSAKEWCYAFVNRWCLLGYSSFLFRLNKLVIGRCQVFTGFTLTSPLTATFS